MKNFRVPAALAFCVTLLATSAWAAQPLETETARTLKEGHAEVGYSYEFQTSTEGTETSVPFAAEYGLSDYVEIMVEPVPYTKISPAKGKGNGSAKGVGDVEVTSTFRFNDEKGLLPAFGVAAELKYALATDPLIGTGEPDYTGYLIMSKRFGRFDTHYDFGYTVPGSPAGIHLNNYFDYGVAAEYFLNGTFDFAAEVIGNTASVAGAEGEGAGPGAITAEATTAEQVGMLGGRIHFNEHVTLALGVTYDNKHAVLFRPGITLAF